MTTQLHLNESGSGTLEGGSSGAVEEPPSTILEGGDICVSCPWCKGSIVISPSELNCRIFRHGVFVDSGQPMNPHAPREECERLVAEERIRGCGKPFRVDGAGERFVAVECDYI